jgi:hypothetical protein
MSLVSGFDEAEPLSKVECALHEPVGLNVDQPANEPMRRR